MRSCLVSAAVGFLMYAVASTCLAVECNDGGSQSEMDACDSDRIAVAEKAMKRAYSRYKATLASAEDVKNLEKSQKLWESFRKFECYSIVPQDDWQGVGYSQWASCYVLRTEHRIKELKVLGDCTANGCRPARKP